ncbi:hydrogenase expression/formation protein HypE [Myxococcota bacterium]|nr:hydrogenase expression/formation protein HypE [Myxococcota bacterium]MBU1430701.1 hydrogenase expression/formation protein HypE [Myxococcota bacterium]MBU1896736.1 hydrogenase expression/formation protein HypE [Myxococcota bacterium]
MSQVLMAHGGGGELTRQLLVERVLPRLANPLLNPLLDSAILERPSGRVCLTTDSFVVQPLFFPGGDIGRLAVCGTVNDLTCLGARPLGLSLALILEEGLELETLERVIDSLARTAEEAGVPIITGDTKVIERQRGDGILINTTGIGVLPEGLDLRPARINAGDLVILTGVPAEHGLAILSVREGLGFETALASDAAPLNGLAAPLLALPGLRFMRDPTRGGVAGVLADLVEETGLSVEIEERALPLSPIVRHASEMLGLDPLNVANEGKLVIVIAPADASTALARLRAHPLGRHAAIIGQIKPSTPPLAELITAIGGRRIIQRPMAEATPRIC